MQNSNGPLGHAELGYPDFFSDLDHPGGIDDVPLSAIFPPKTDVAVLGESDITKLEKQLKEAKKTLEALEDTYYKNDCDQVLRDKSSLELVGSVAGWVSVFMPLKPDGQAFKLLEVAVNIIGKVATETSNEIGQSAAFASCEKCNRDIGLAKNKVEAAHERYKAEINNMFGIYSVSVQRKKQSETRIRDWKNYAYQLEVHWHRLDPSRPKPSAPLYAFKSTPVPAQRMMRLGADIIQNHLPHGV